MTGYAVIRRNTSAGELTVTLKSVNHRGLDLHFYQSGELGQYENAMRTLLKKNIARGHIEVRLSLARDKEAVSFDMHLLNRYLTLFRQASEKFQLDSKPDLNAFFTLPGVLESTRGEAKPLDKDFESEIIAALEACLTELNGYREQEARELRGSFEHETAAIEEATASMSAIRSQAVPQFLQRLRERLANLMEDSTIPESRLAEEAALLVDKSDIEEELTRLAVHTRELRRILEEGGEIGKRLDFLLQEMNRETNTIMSKTSGIGDAGLTITSLGLGIKVNIERMREQALNLE